MTPSDIADIRRGPDAPTLGGLEPIRIFDTTLRDGEQAPGCGMTPHQKLAVARQLTVLGVDVIEAGFPAASEGEASAVAAIANAVGRADSAAPIICGLARANPSDIDAAARAIERAARPRIHTFIATSERHMTRKLQLSPAEVLARAYESVRRARSLVDDVEFSPEDATRSDGDFLIAVLRAAIDAGATTLNIPDTVGYATPDEYGALIARVCRLARGTPGVVVSTHCHDDLGLAVANSLEGVRAGARQVECTVNALGERAGNASLEEVVMAIQTRPSVFHCRTSVNTREILASSRLVSHLTGVAVPPNKAIVGANAFAHESGIHQDGVIKDRDTYEIMLPESVGVDESRLVLGKHSGRNALRHRLEALGYHLTRTELAGAFDRFKALADSGTVGKEIDDAALRRLIEPAVSRQGKAGDVGNSRTLFEKVWNAHLVRAATPATPAVLYVDLHLVHEVTSAQAFAELDRRGRRVRRPDRTIATMDHSTPTTPAVWTTARETGALPVLVTGDAEADRQLDTLARNCRAHGIPLYPLGNESQGIVHVIGPELGRTQPGMTIVCGDSHTSTHGAFGALAFGIGTSQVGHVLATQCVLHTPSRVFEIRVDGALGRGVSAKDLILAIIARIGVDGATGFVVEYSGDAIRALSMEGRMTVCNMSIEAGARAGMIAPDDVTFEYLANRPGAPTRWDEAVAHWRRLPSDDDAVFDRSVSIDANAIEPMLTFGTNPGMGIPISGRVPDPAAVDGRDRAALERALAYMGLAPGAALLGRPIDTVFLGSCTNSRLSDLRAAATLLRGARVASGVRMLVVPGSNAVKRAAEAEGLDRVFRDAGAEWREAGCSMCIAMNGDRVGPGQLAVSTSNRNFEGRQGPGARTLLASPLTAAASAIAGAVADPRPLLP